MELNLLMAPLKQSQLTSLKITYLHRLTKKDAGRSYLTRSSTIEEIMVRSTRMIHSLRVALEIGDEE